MKLYSFHDSNNCRRVTSVIAHLGLSVETVEPDMMGGELQSPAYRALNPNGKAPLLVDGELKLWEGRAIMQYLATKKPSGLWPSDPAAQADILRWQFWEACHLSRATTPYAYENLFKKMVFKQEADAAVLAAAEKELHAHAPVLNAHLESHAFLVGEAVTLADFSVGACFSYAEASGLPWAPYRHIQAWMKRLDEPPAWRRLSPRLRAASVGREHHLGA